MRKLTKMLKSTLSDKLVLKCCVYNASGPRCTTKEQLILLENSNSGAVLTKSCTLFPRDGNQPPKYYYENGVSINSNGLENKGVEFYSQYITEGSKPYIVSVSGLSLEENIKIIKVLTLTDSVDAIELNLSCPNIPGHPQTGYSQTAVIKLLTEATKIIKDKKTFGVKLPPYFDVSHIEQMARIISLFPIHFVVCCNSLGNGLLIDSDTETVRIKPKGGLGGIGGTAIKPIALSNVYQFRKLLPKHVRVVGCGGISTGKDAFEFILAGASAVQIGTVYYEEGSWCFERIVNELEQIMKQKGYNCLEDFRGKVKIFSYSYSNARL